MKTKVCITVDTEFSIAGALGPPFTDYPVSDPFVWCWIDGRSHGLGFLLDSFMRYETKATFFVEALHRNYFSHDPMAKAVTAIKAAGQDIQLHLHPCWTVFRRANWRELVTAEPRQDDFAGRPVEDCVALIRQGSELFCDWGLQTPQLLRTGGLQHGMNIYQAMAQTGLTAASNIGLAIYRCGDPDFDVYSGAHQFAGVLEFPVLSYEDASFGRLKSLTITGSSFREIEFLLWQAYRASLPVVVILTHPFEYAQGYDQQFRGARPHRLNQSKLTRLCQFLQTHHDHFEAASLPAALASFPADRIGENRMLKSPLPIALARLAGNALYEQGSTFLGVY
ncbi:MAG: polysaccharide deacetylase [Gammaproteobacteria bacterium]